ncbi:hypothetical protein [Thermococcus nautili]|uniref:hypothetical protein n=1 Tax=Thermococcus nautili TaxID=195522 RepID=UPI00373AF111
MTARAKEILTLDDELIISPISINEAVYVSFRKLAKEKHGISNIYDAKRFSRHQLVQNWLKRRFPWSWASLEMRGLIFYPMRIGLR